MPVFNLLSRSGIGYRAFSLQQILNLSVENQGIKRKGNGDENGSYGKKGDLEGKENFTISHHSIDYSLLHQS